MTPTSAEIVVVTYGNPEVERRCIDSVRRHTDLTRHTLTVVDNFVRDANLCKVWNEAIAASNHDFICLLNSDTEVEPAWLDKMIATAVDNNAEAVGPLSNCVGAVAQRGEKRDSATRTEYLSGFCLLLRKSAWTAAKGFREDFTFYGNESEFMRRLTKKYVCNSVFVQHVGGSSVKAVGRSQEERHLAKEFWARHIAFNWKTRLAILGLGPGIPGPLWNGIDQAIIEMGREGMAAKHFNLETVTTEDLKAFAPDVVITCSGTRSIDRAKALLKPIKAKKGFWFNDLRVASEVQPDRFKHVFDGLFLCFGNDPDYKWREWKERIGAETFYMPQGSRIHPELAALDIQRELVFIGDIERERFHGDRRVVMNALKADVLNALPGTQARRDIEAQSRETYRQSRFVLSMSPKVSGYTSLRTYNIMAYGGLLLVRDFPGLNRLLKDGEHCLVWSTIEEAKAIINKWTNRPDECERIRKRAWRYGQARHTAMRRLMNIIANLTTPDTTFWGWV